MEDLILGRIGGLIAQHSGICIRDQDYPLVSEKLWRRIKALGLGSLEAYHDYLLRELHKQAQAVGNGAGGDRTEWQELYGILTINESYFFRDTNQFRLLSDRILPDILSRNQSASGGGTRPRLRIWSAGCSTGEELYSIAIALTELGFAWDRWDALLIGTDLSPLAIDTARRGLYSNWSFRQMPSDLQRKYFQPHHKLYKICDSLQQRVAFQCGNLLTNAAATRPSDIDLIVCRNVFIYLNSRAIEQIVATFYKALVPQGYLLTGHTELYSQNMSQFDTLSFPESILYRKPSTLTPLSNQKASPGNWASPPSLKPSIRQVAAQPQPVFPASSRQAPPPAPDRPLDQALQEANALLQQKAYTKAIQHATVLYTTYPQCDEARKIAAQAYANSGLYHQATQLCLQVLNRQPLSTDMYYLMAQIAEDQNDLEATKAHLRKIIYLDASYVKAYLDLASIYEREKQPEKTQKMRSHALTLLAKLPFDAVLDPNSTTTVREWQTYLKTKMSAQKI